MSQKEIIKIGGRSYEVRTVLNHSSKPLRKFPISGISLGIAIAILILIYGFTLMLLGKVILKWDSIFVTIILLIGISFSLTAPILFWHHLPFPAAGGGFDKKAFLLVLGIMSIVYSLPALVLYWFINPTHYKKAIEIFVLLVSIGVSSLFYDKDKLPSLADKVTYFAGIILTPVGILEILL